MYEHQTYREIMGRMLARIPDELDKREGSVIFDALAPAAAELAALYAELDVQLALSFADTADGEYLTRRAAEHGVRRKASSRAMRLGRFFGAAGGPAEVPLRSRLAAEGTAYEVAERLAPGTYRLVAELPGRAGNEVAGALLPLDYIDGLARAELADVLVPGEDEEGDAELRARFWQAVSEQPFGGNIADYRAKIGGLPGVGGVKIHPAWNGGGTVKATVIASDFAPAAAALVQEVQAAIDPESAGQGIGLAPIGHRVTIVAADAVPVDIATQLTLRAGVSAVQLERDIEAAAEAYLLELRRAWAGESRLIVRISQLETRVLALPGVEDIGGTTLNGAPANLELEADEVPTLGTVTLNG
ncbi:baseplate J/gp47 family protein [Paenibacillus sp. B01]|uniref:baseplate J/gp47 family protein n=1 Tax=Paenibacillus sp. B01 TaxID=2660554 RepID=UPI00129AEF0B|nr:baseplate J/gp47 family protein [Paenibacillus sp. B01]QGG57409.1 phage tail protein [Paenibacillus sp. B01]